MNAAYILDEREIRSDRTRTSRGRKATRREPPYRKCDQAERRANGGGGGRAADAVFSRAAFSEILLASPSVLTLSLRPI